MHAANRLAVHQSLVHPRDALELTGALPGTGRHSVGLHVGGTAEVEPWWHGGAGERNLARLVAPLLETRVTVLDVGRVLLAPTCRATTCTPRTGGCSTWVPASAPGTSPPASPPRTRAGAPTS